MANRTFMRGKFTLRLEHMDELRPRFFWKNSWSDVKHPDVIATLGYALLKSAGVKGDLVPGGLDDRPPRGWGFQTMQMHNNSVKFVMGFKDELKLQQAFVSLLPVIAYEWEIEQDWRETATAFYNEDDPAFYTDTVTRWDSKISRSVENAEEVVEHTLMQLAMFNMDMELEQRVNAALEARQKRKLESLK